MPEATGATLGGDAPLDPLPLRVALPSASVIIAPIVIGHEAGIFEEEGVDLSLTTGTAANTNNVLVAGRADIVMGITPAALTLVPQRSITGIWQPIDGAQASNLFTRADIPSVEALRDLDSCVMASPPPGQGSYINTTYINESLGLDCELQIYPDIPLQVAALASNRVDATVGELSTRYQAVTEGKANLVLDAQDEDVREQYDLPSFLPFTMYYGLSENLEGKREVVVRFVRAMLRTHELMTSEPVEELAALLHKNSDYAVFSIPELIEALPPVIPFMNPNDGFITEKQWSTGVQDFAKWGGLEDFDPEGPDFSYDQRVDMSFYEAAVEGSG